MTTAIHRPRRGSSRFTLPALLLGGAQLLAFVAPPSANDVASALITVSFLWGAAVLLWRAWRGTHDAATRVLTVLALGGTAWWLPWIELVLSTGDSSWLVPADSALAAAVIAPVALVAFRLVGRRTSPRSIGHRAAMLGASVAAAWLLVCLVCIPAFAPPWGVGWQ